MARSESESEFDLFVQQNQQNLMAARGATSPFRPTNLELGEYYAVIDKATRSMMNAKTYTPDGKETGQTHKAGRVQLKLIVICSADPRLPIEHRRQFAGSQEYINHTLDTQDQWDRCCSDLEAIGVRTTNFVSSESLIQNPQIQLTMAQGLDLITRSKPLCKIAVTESKGNKYVNYRSSVTKEDVERLLGTSLDVNQFLVASQEPVAPSIPSQSYPGAPVYPEPVPVSSPLTGAPIYPSPVAAVPVYPAVGAPFAGQSQNLEYQPDGTWFDKASKHFYDQQGNYVPITPTLPAPPSTPIQPAPWTAPSQMQSGIPQPPSMPGLGR